MELPKKYKHQEVEERWRNHWETTKTYQWQGPADRKHTFAVDTPPPTVSGSLHIGHVFSYTHTDALARFQRMQGKHVFYPMGWDDNGLPTERRVQNVFGITCQPELPYDETLTYEKGHKKKNHEYTPVSRRNFIEACELLTKEDEQAFETLWRKLGLSVDWALQYSTIDSHCRQMSQASFLDCVSKGKIAHSEAPGMWDVDFQTAVAQAEVEDRPKTGAYHHIQFSVESGGHFEIATTRPELLAACIAVVAHPDDDRYKALMGTYAVTPLFHARVPILPSRHADPEKGTGILMVCTFGDADDVTWWQQSDLPVKQVIGRDGCLLPVTFGQAPFESVKPDLAQQQYDQIVGKRAKQARKIMVTLLSEPGSSVCGTTQALTKEPEIIEHPVKFYEKGESPVEFISTRQWFITVLNDKLSLLAQGEKIDWHPPFMKTRYTNWVEGLNQEWCISRQRFFGVPFPVWYRLDDQGDPLYDDPIYASTEQLPIDPLTQCPDGYTLDQRNQPNGFIGDPDVMDTWATSSLTPQLMSHWGQDEERHQSVFPMDIRPQSHEIIRTWAFYTIVKAWIHNESIPWHHVVISGWVLDPDRKKMSKSKGNVVTPEHLLDEYSSDAIRYWACKARLGTDTAFEDTVFAVGKKLTTKLFNASKFVLMQVDAVGEVTLDDITEPVDLDWMQQVGAVIQKATDRFNDHDYATALDVTERLFWDFCDHYIELVKVRAYREEDITKRKSACAALYATVSILCRCFAPALPYITEEIWSWAFAKDGESIHKAQWPTVSALPTNKGQSGVFNCAKLVMSEIRATKTQAQKSMKVPVRHLEVTATHAFELQCQAVESDIIRAGTIEAITYTENGKQPEPVIAVSLVDSC